jgi:type I restriction enzyme S subunit
MKKIPEIRFPEFSGEWVEKKLGDICKFQQGVQIDLELQKNKPMVGYVKFLRIENFTQNSNDYRYIPINLAQNKFINKDEIVIVRYGASAGFVARGKEGVLANNLFKLIPNNNLIKNNFLYYYLIREKAFKFFQSEMSGAAMPALSFGIVKRLKLFFPPTLTEQEKIAEFLSSVDEKIEITAKKIEKLKDYKKGLLQKMLNVINGEPEIRFKEFSGKWVEERLGNLIEEYTQKNKNEYEPVAIGIYGIKKRREIFSKELTNNITVNKIIFKNTLTFGIGTNQIVYGILLKDEYYSVSPAYKTFLIKNVNSSFLNYLLLVKNKEMSAKYMIISARQGKSVNIKEMLEYKIHIPPTLEEQQKIADFLSSIDEKIELNENRLKALKTYKKGLLQKMFV